MQVIQYRPSVYSPLLPCVQNPPLSATEDEDICDLFPTEIKTTVCCFGGFECTDGGWLSPDAQPIGDGVLALSQNSLCSHSGCIQ